MRAATGAGRVHVVGAGLAGLAAALDLAASGRAVTVWEASGHAGGRCWSFEDARLGRVIDNGNHLILSGNAGVLDHAARLGAAHLLETAPEAAFPFVDLGTRERWTVAIPRSPLGGWRAAARPSGTRLGDLADVARLMAAGPGRSVAEAIPGRGAMWARFWEPMTLAVLNAPPERASARLLRDALRRSFLKGADACRPVFAPGGLGPALVEPAVRALEAGGTALRLRAPVRSLGTDGGRVVSLGAGEGAGEALAPGDAVVLAVPPQAAATLVPGWDPASRAGPAIVNAHFRMPPGATDGLPPLTGVVGGAVHWIFVRGDVVSTTVSGVGDAGATDRAALLAAYGAEVRAATGLPEPVASRLLVERRATFEQSAAGVAARRGTRTAWRNLYLAGDHTATGLPATLEGAIVSGRRAAAAVLADG